MKFLHLIFCMLGMRWTSFGPVPLATCFLDIGGDTPDNSGVNEAARRNAELSDKAFNWFTAEYERTAPDRQKAADEASAVTQANLQNMQQQTELAKEYADYNRSTFRPLEQRIVADSTAYDTPERRQAAADAAVADVNQAVAQQRDARMADLASYGVAPDSARSQSAMASGGINASKAVASAAKGARDKVEATGRAMMADAANLGRGLPSAQATAVQTGTAAGNSAVGASNASLGASMSGASLMQQGFNTAQQGYNSAGQLYGRAADIENSSTGNLLNFTGSVFNSYANMKTKSDPAVKKNRRPISPEASMAALRKTNIEEWEYDPEKGGPDDGGRKRIGPMADEVQENMGDDVAPNGELLNVASMLGVVANAVKNVDRRLSRLGA